MSEQNHVAAAIGGKPAEIEQFINVVKSAGIIDEHEIIPLFKVLKLYKDLSIFVYYQHCCEWFILSEETWRSLCELADNQKLSWVFYRVGSFCQDIDWNDNSDKSYFDKRMLKLFEIRHPIHFKHPKLYDLG